MEEITMSQQTAIDFVSQLVADGVRNSLTNQDIKRIVDELEGFGIDPDALGDDEDDYEIFHTIVTRRIRDRTGAPA